MGSYSPLTSLDECFFSLVSVQGSEDDDNCCWLFWRHVEALHGCGSELTVGGR
jgi:hypothetical protein